MSYYLKNKRQVDPILTKLALGYRQKKFIGEQVLPVVPVDKEGVRVPVFGKSSFVEYDTERAPRAASNVITLEDATMLPVVLEEHDLAAGMDYREQAESMFDERAKATRKATEGVQLKQEIQIARLVQSRGVYDNGLVNDLSGGTQWNDAASTPIKDIGAAKEAVRSKCGETPNVLVLGASVYNALKFHPGLLAHLGSAALQMLTMEHLKMLFEVDEIIIGNSIATPDGKKLNDIWGKFASLIVRPAISEHGNDEGVQAFGYTFRKRGMPMVDRYDGVGGKVEYARYTDIRKSAILGGSCGYLFDKAIA